MEANIIMVRYGELSTKGKNKGNFIRLLSSNIRNALKKYKGLVFEVKHDHIYIFLNGESYDAVARRLKDVSGIYSFSPVYRCSNDLDEIARTALIIAELEQKQTFKIITKRADKAFPHHSDEINRTVASLILKRTQYRVDVHQPELKIHITVREADTYIFSSEEAGAGGYPLGIGGKSLMMLSGGIDSPVAAYLMMKRGVKLECIHFAAPPYTSAAVIEKIKDLLHVLNAYQASIKVYIVPFTELQRAIYDHVPVSYAITVMRRMMYRIACIVAARHNDLVLANGESIGQVASQTLKSIQTIESVSTLPVIRPLATYDKLEIIRIARAIGTYDISIRPFEDCCTIFEVKDPTTAPHAERIAEYEAKFDWRPYVEDCANHLEVLTIAEDDETDSDGLL